MKTMIYCGSYYVEAWFDYVLGKWRCSRCGKHLPHLVT